MQINLPYQGVFKGMSTQSKDIHKGMKNFGNNNIHSYQIGQNSWQQTYKSIQKLHHDQKAVHYNKPRKVWGNASNVSWVNQKLPPQSYISQKQQKFLKTQQQKKHDIKTAGKLKNLNQHIKISMGHHNNYQTTAGKFHRPIGQQEINQRKIKQAVKNLKFKEDKRNYDIIKNEEAVYKKSNYQKYIEEAKKGKVGNNFTRIPVKGDQIDIITGRVMSHYPYY